MTYTFNGQDEKKKEYRLDSAQNCDRASRSKNSPIGIPHNLKVSRFSERSAGTRRSESVYPNNVCVAIRGSDLVRRKVFEESSIKDGPDVGEYGLQG